MRYLWLLMVGLLLTGACTSEAPTTPTTSFFTACQDTTVPGDANVIIDCVGDTTNKGTGTGGTGSGTQLGIRNGTGTGQP
jgi:hypothetical protein